MTRGSIVQYVLTTIQKRLKMISDGSPSFVVEVSHFIPNVIDLRQVIAGIRPTIGL